MKSLLLIGALSSAAVTAAVNYNITHPNLKDAYSLAAQAIQHIHEAQQANQGVEFGGHGDKAIQHLEQAQAELIEGDKYNDAHQHKK